MASEQQELDLRLLVGHCFFGCSQPFTGATPDDLHRLGEAHYEANHADEIAAIIARREGLHG